MVSVIDGTREMQNSNTTNLNAYMVFLGIFSVRSMSVKWLKRLEDCFPSKKEKSSLNWEYLKLYSRLRGIESSKCNLPPPKPLKLGEEKQSKSRLRKLRVLWYSCINSVTWREKKLQKGRAISQQGWQNQSRELADIHEIRSLKNGQRRVGSQ